MMSRTINAVSGNVSRLLSEYQLQISAESICEDLNCTLCGKLVVDAYQTGCGCKYCRECVIRYLADGNEYCRGGKDDCLEEILVLEENVFRSPALNKMVLRVRVHCPNRACTFICQLAMMEEHLRVCDHLPSERMSQSGFFVEVIDNLRNELGVLKEEIEALKKKPRFDETAKRLIIEHVKNEIMVEIRERMEEERRLHMEEKEIIKVEMEAIKMQAVNYLDRHEEGLEAVKTEIKRICEESLSKTDLSENVVKMLMRKIDSVQEKAVLMKRDIETLKTHTINDRERHLEILDAVRTEMKKIVIQRSSGQLPRVVYEVEPLFWCPHLSHVQPLPNEDEDEIEVPVECSECPSVEDNNLCLTCFKVSCGRFVKGHMLEHFGLTGHPLVLSLDNLSTWCYECEAFIQN